MLHTSFYHKAQRKGPLRGGPLDYLRFKPRKQHDSLSWSASSWPAAGPNDPKIAFHGAYLRYIRDASPQEKHCGNKFSVVFDNKKH